MTLEEFTKFTKYLEESEALRRAGCKFKDEYCTDYPSEPIGADNPYYCCSSCGRSDPQINGRLDGHHDFCEWAKKKKDDISKMIDYFQYCDPDQR